MVQVYTKCRDLLNNTDMLPMWWLDDSPAVFKADVEGMTAVDCHRLKRELAKEVNEEAEVEANEFDLGRIMGLVLALAAIFVLFILLCGLKRRKRNSDEVEAFKPEPEEAPPIFRFLKKNKKRVCKSWMRKNCRPLFLHNETQIKEFSIKAEREVAVHTERTQQKIALWTKARDREAQKKMDKLQRTTEKASRKKKPQHH
ncbi:uncharacterized protein LOC108042694 [Drosophila rhopaloa]|uniref:Uncharacterized protein LOC108042694 n=1 Tax=Drosophila rhopaloa TaxID=1041015 RepID=A0A6P4ENH6_DRORH|nr:uncharacterized protein LOC108042694 [Drosophila rhopaloa]